MAKVLIVDDEADLLDLVSHHLKRNGFEVLTAREGWTGLQLATTEFPDLLVLDLLLPDLHGIEVLQRIRKEAGSDMPVILLTALGEEDSRIRGFELGADDYVVKPFSPRELILRIQSVLRRSQGTVQSAESEVLERADIRLDRERHEVTVSGAKVDVTPIEFRLLACLMERPGRVLTRSHILDIVWGDEVYVSERTVDVHIKRLRTKLDAVAEKIETVRGVGYLFRD